MLVKFFLYILSFLYIFGNSITVEIIPKEDIAEVKVWSFIKDKNFQNAFLKRRPLPVIYYFNLIIAYNCV